MMLGKKIHLMPGPGQGAPAAAAVAQQAPQPEVRSVEVRVEGEQVRFQAQGSVTTADGRQIEFRSDLALSRQFVEVVAGAAATPSGNKQDPLVLNFDGRGVRLLADRASFDLNSDGQAEQVPLVATGSGVLFLDRNGDGVATNGSELFGPRTGDGFGELAQADSDANGWIDEADPVYGELRVWFQDGGAGRVYGLAELGVGAISTASVATQFDLRTSGNALLGQIRASGVYLRENGQAGVISHVDLVA